MKSVCIYDLPVQCANSGLRTRLHLYNSPQDYGFLDFMVFIAESDSLLTFFNIISSYLRINAALYRTSYG